MTYIVIRPPPVLKRNRNLFSGFSPPESSNLIRSIKILECTYEVRSMNYEKSPAIETNELEKLRQQQSEVD